MNNIQKKTIGKGLNILYICAFWHYRCEPSKSNFVLCACVQPTEIRYILNVALYSLSYFSFRKILLIYNVLHIKCVCGWERSKTFIFFFVTYQWNAEILSQLFESTQNQNKFLVRIINHNNSTVIRIILFFSFLLSSNGFLWKRQIRITNHCA